MFISSLRFSSNFCRGIALILGAFVVFKLLGYSEEIAALLTIGFSDLYFGRFAK